MPKFRFDKLVRDKIIEHQLKSGVKPSYRHLDKLDHRNELINKLIEEAKEVLEAEEKDVAEELADVQQALDDLVDQFDLKRADIKLQQKLKRQKNGAFKKGIYVDYVETLEEDPYTQYYRSNSDRFPEISD